MYLEFYGLQEQPFNITPDPRFLYFSPRHREAFDHLIYGIDNRKGFIELTGEVGSGKTTLCRAMLSRMDANTQSAMVLNPCLSAVQLLRAILHDFGLRVETTDALECIEHLNTFLLEQAGKGNNVVVVIDEAQDLTPDVLEYVRLLNNLETDQNKLMQIVLSGQPELRRRLEQPELRQLRQRILVRSRLDALDEMETHGYIAHRLVIAGAPDDVRFDPKAVQLLHKHARGIPRVINAICDNAMLAGFVNQIRAIGVQEVKRALKEMEVSV